MSHMFHWEHMRHLKQFLHISCKGTLISPSILLPFNVLVPRHKFFVWYFCSNSDVIIEMSMFHILGIFWHTYIHYALVEFTHVCIHMNNIHENSYVVAKRKLRHNSKQNLHLILCNLHLIASSRPLHITTCWPCRSISNQENHIITILLETHVQRGLCVLTLTLDVSSLEWT